MVYKKLARKKLIYLILAIVLITVALSCGSQILFANTGSSPSKTDLGTVAGNSKVLSLNQAAETVSKGYRTVCFDGSYYIAAGTGGRIDRIDPYKTVIGLPSVTTSDLNGITSINDTHVAVGDHGVILLAKGKGDFKHAKSGTTKSLYSVTVFNGNFLSAGAGGTLLHSNDGEHWTKVKSGVKNNIISIAANEKMCMAVTEDGQILMSDNGRKWSALDYNTFYEGCAEPCRFKSIRTCGDAFFIAGEYLNNPGCPAILSSDTGEIWMEHVLNKINDKPGEESYPLTVNSVAADSDQIVAACGEGKLLTVTDCSVCNKLDVICDKNIIDLVSANGFIALVGDGFWFDIRKSDAFRQYDISAGQALKDQNEGAFIVDVRTDEEYAQLHIKDCIHIPLDTLEAELEKEVPDKAREIIFYCQKGVRAQKALEKALLMGYERLYNLGGIGDWPYATETGNTWEK